MKRIDLGDEVKDSLSKFKGIVTAIHIYLQGCVRMSVTTTDKEPKTMGFDEPQLVVVKKKRTEKGSKSWFGGPDKYVDEGKETGFR